MDSAVCKRIVHAISNILIDNSHSSLYHCVKCDELSGVAVQSLESETWWVVRTKREAWVNYRQGADMCPAAGRYPG